VREFSLQEHELNLQQLPSPSLVVQATSVFTIVVGCLVLLGWWLELDFLKNCFSLSIVTMKANTALCFVLSGLSLWLSSRETHKRIPILARVCASTVLAIGTLTLCEYLFGWNLRIDELLSHDSIPSLLTSHPGRMGLNSALNFMLVGRALELVSMPKTSRSYWYAQVIALQGGVISLVALMGYAYNVEILYSINPYTTAMALHTAVTFIVVFVGILRVRSDEGLMQVVISDDYGSMLARRLLTAAILVPLVLGWLILQGERAGEYDSALALSLLVVVLIVSFCVLIWHNASLVEGLSSARKETLEALSQSEERFRLAVDNIPNVFAIYDAHRRFQFVNAAGLQRAHKSLEEIIGRTDEEILPPEVTKTYLATLIKAQETGNSQTTEATIKLPGYGTFTLLIKYVPILNEKKEIYQILLFVEDITVRKQAEEALRNQGEWLEEVLNLMPTPLLFIEPGTARISFANRAADEVAGGKFPKAQSIEDYRTYYCATDAAGNPIPFEEAPGIRVARGERLEGFELDWHIDEGIRSLLIYADTLPAMHGHSDTCVLTFQDITNLKRVEKALSLGYKRLQLLFNTASDLLSSYQPVALVESVFRKLAEQIGLDFYFNYLVDENSQVLELTSYSGIPSEVAQKIQMLKFGQGVCGSVAKERQPISLENIQQSTDSKTEYLRSFGTTAFYCYPLISQGKLIGTLSFGSCSRAGFTQNENGMMQAVCDQIAMAMERASLIGSLQQQTEQLQAANRMKDEFLAILSHELRSPLNAILGWAQLLRSGRQFDESKIAKALETIERNARAQTQLIEDLLDISRMIRGKLRLNVRSCDLTAIIEGAIETVRLAAEAKEIQITSVIEDKVGLVSGDSERLQQVVWNLLSNAIKFTPSGGQVQVRLSAPRSEGSHAPSYAQITVSDTGIGISREFLPYVFERFRQADSSSTRSHGGLGLGLAIVRHLVELHGGTVHVESLGKGKGATFLVKLPLLKTKEGQTNKLTKGINQQLLSESPISPLSHTLLNGVRVVIVDDEIDSRDFIATVLQQCQAEVIAVASVPEAIQAIIQHKPDVLVSDIGMPEEDGYSLIRKIRALERAGEISFSQKGKKLPAAALTAYARPEDRRRAIQEGYQLHLPKPVEAAELITVVASLAGRTS
jgi:PAS domain S-box-containing protein